ncbi:MAG: hypothetical protein Q9227_006900 [Pyrenula ochraceoflavens]
MQTIKTHSKTPLPTNSPQTDARPWTAHVTLDTLAKVLRNSIFHPFITLLIPICLRAQVTPYSHPSFIITTGWAILVSLYAILSSINHKVAYGPPREPDWEEEVVVISGGGRGLGRLLAEVYRLRGVSVAILDILPEPTNEDIEGINWYTCDVGDPAEVERAVQRIQEDLGPPTILILNAATSIHPYPLSSPSLTPQSTTTTLTTNLHSAFHLTHALLHILLSSPTGAHIITISSILSHIPPANLSAYAASKAGLTTFHESLTAELRSFPRPPPGGPQEGHVKTLLVETGQLATPLFAGMQTPNAFLAPVVETSEVVKEIVKAVDFGEGGVIRLPEYAKWVNLWYVLPDGVKRVVRWASGVDGAVEGMRRAMEREGEREREREREMAKASGVGEKR